MGAKRFGTHRRGGESMGPAKSDKIKTQRTTIAIKRSTKNRLDSNRFQGQSYDGFILHLIDSWENQKKGDS